VDIELKTFLIPNVGQDFQEMIRRRDLKLIRRQEKTIEQLDPDLHVQIVFKQLRMRKDDWLKKQPSISLASQVRALLSLSKNSKTQK